MSTGLASGAGKAAAKKTSAKRHASKKPAPLAPMLSIAEQLSSLPDKLLRALAGAFGDTVSIGFGEQFDHDWHSTRPAIVIRYAVGKDVALSAAQLTARRKMLAAWHDDDYALARSVFSLEESFV